MGLVANGTKDENNTSTSYIIPPSDNVRPGGHLGVRGVRRGIYGSQVLIQSA